jgi:hypothetical protein
MMFIGLILFGTFLVYIVFVAGASRNNHQDWSGQEIRERFPGPRNLGQKPSKRPHHIRRRFILPPFLPVISNPIVRSSVAGVISSTFIQ